jgi:perosamine synthetase
VEQAITARTKAILAVDVFGQPADYDRLNDIAQRTGLVVIEDACEAIGAEYKGCKAGTLVPAAVFAFYPNKQMTTGEGVSSSQTGGLGSPFPQPTKSRSG